MENLKSDTLIVGLLCTVLFCMSLHGCADMLRHKEVLKRLDAMESKLEEEQKNE